MTSFWSLFRLLLKHFNKNICRIFDRKYFVWRIDSITEEIHVKLFVNELTLLIGLSWPKHQSQEHNYFFLNSKLQKEIYLKVIVCISLKINNISPHWVFRQLMIRPSLVPNVISTYGIIYSGSIAARLWIWGWCWWSYMRLYLK